MAIAVLAVAIAANTATFSVVNALLLRPLPVRAPNELTFVYSRTSAYPLVATYDEAVSWAQRNDYFSGVAAMSEDGAGIGEGADAKFVRGESVSANYFDVLGVGAAAGRVLNAAQDGPDSPPVVVISDRLWRKRFGSDPAILGKAIRLDDASRVDSGWRYQVVGVIPAEFRGIASAWTPADFWVPLVQRQRELDLGLGFGKPRVPWVIARRHRGVTRSDVEPFIMSRLTADEQASQLSRYRAARTIKGTAVVSDTPKVALPLDYGDRISVERLAASVLAVGALVLAVGIINLMGVTVARSIVRAPEMAVRLSLGASRFRLARQMTCEALVLSLLGGLAGVVISRPVVSLFVASLPARLDAASLDASLDWRVLTFALLVSIAAGVAVGLAPVRRTSRVDLMTMLGAAQASSGRDRSRLRSWIVVPQIAACMTLLLVAGIGLEALLQVWLQKPGYRSDGVGYAVWNPMRIRPRDPSQTAEQRRASYRDDSARQERFQRDLLERASAVPEFEAVALADSLPFGGGEQSVVLRDGYREGSPHVTVQVSRVSTGYFDVMGLPQLAGRLINDADTKDSPKVAVVDEALAEKLWPGANAIGQVFGTHVQGSTNQPDWIEVVGVTGSVRHPLSEGETRSFMYLPVSQANPGPVARILVARGRDREVDVVGKIRSVISAVDPGMNITGGRTVDEAIGDLRYPRRIGTTLLVTSALIALGLASLGLYGVVSFSVSRRIRELGIRAALGADRLDLIRLVMREGALLAVVGSLAGLFAAYSAVRVVSNQVFAMPPLDGKVILIVSALLAAVVLLACYLPARRAGKVNPASLLRT